MAKANEIISKTDLSNLERAEEIAQFGHWEFDLNTRKVRGSKGAWKIYGHVNAPITIEQIQKIPLPEYRARLDSALENLISKGIAYDVVFKIRRTGDGKIRDIHSVAEFDKRKNLVFGVIHDITDIKNVESSLKERDDDIRFIAENTSDVIWSMDITGTIKYVSPSVEKLRGFKPEQIIGKNFREIVTPDSIIKAEELIKTFLSSLKSGTHSSESVTEIFEQPTADGGFIWNETVISPVFNDDGTFRVFLGVSRNITERVNAEKALEEREKKFMMAIEATGLGLWDQNFEKDTITRNANWYKMLGYNPGEIGKGVEGWKSLIHPEDFKMAEKKASEHESGRTEFFSVEHRMKAKSGEWHWIHNWGKIIKRDNKGNPIRAIGVHLDNTQKVLAEKLIHEKTEKFESLYQNIPIALFRSTPGGKIITCNKKALEMYKFESVEDFLNQPAQDFYTDVKSRNYMLEQVRNHGELKGHITHENRADGTRIWVKSDYVGIFDDDKNLVYLDCIAEDITDKKEAEDALVESEKRYRTLVEKSPDGIAILKDMVIFFINDSAIKMLGGTEKNQFINKSILDFIKTNQQSEKQDELIKFIKGDEQQKSAEGRLSGLNKKELPVELHANQIEYKGGEAVQLIMRDISDREASRNVLLSGETMLKAITENFPDGIISIVDRNGVFTLVEGQNLKELGLKTNELIGKKIKDVLPIQVIEAIKPILRNIWAGKKEVYDVEIEGKYYTNSVIPISDQSNQIDKFITITTDISDQRKLEQKEKALFEKLESEVASRMDELNEQTARLKESQRALTFLLEDVNDARNELLQVNKSLEAANNDLEAFAYSVSHDLRAPLRHIDGFSQLLENLIEDRPPEADKYFKKIHDSSGRMHNLINDLLSFSRFGRKKLVITTINMQNLIGEVIKNYEPDLDKRKVEWLIHEIPLIRGDFEMIKVVMDNLISNALKFTSRKEVAKIEIDSVLIDDNQIELIVSDNGVGFDNNYAHKMFGVFERLHNNQEFPGTGIGLANVKRIIRSHKGAIRGEGKLNEGATFFITLPLNL